MTTRNHQLVLSVEYLEKKQIQEDAKRNKLSVPDYMRMKLGLPMTRTRLERERLYAGDPDNAVDVEELAKAIFEREDRMRGPIPMAAARREAKRRLMAAQE